MGIFGSKTFGSLQDLLFHQLEDLYDAERRLIEALPRIELAASHPDLKQALSDHKGETELQVDRLNQVFRALDSEPQRETSAAMKGMIQEAQEMADAEGDPGSRDAALIAAAQRIEHYEMAGYGTARDLAEALSDQDTVKQAEANLKEEKSADARLTELSKVVNANAIHSA
jgi:ferritin-like metal-binding protein YciE